LYCARGAGVVPLQRLQERAFDPGDQIKVVKRHGSYKERIILRSTFHRFVARRASSSRTAGDRLRGKGALRRPDVESLESRTLLSESASAQLTLVSTGTGNGAPAYHYAMTVTDTGTTNVGTFWFAWIPGGDFLPSTPSAVSDPSGWSDTLTGSGDSSDGIAIEWVATANAITPGHSLSGFDFTSADSPSVLAGDAPTAAPGTPVLTSFVYGGGPFSDAGFKFLVTQAATTSASTTTLASSAPSVDAGAPVTLSATVSGSGGSGSAPTGTVSFSSGGNAIGSAPVGAGGAAAITTSSLPVGTDAITATYSGDSNYSSSASSPLTETIAPPANAIATTTSLASSNPAAQADVAVVLTATITPAAGSSSGPTGSVTFTQAGAVLGTSPLQGNGTASLSIATLAVGSDAIIATYSGDGVYGGSASAPLAQTITPPPTLMPTIVGSTIPTAVVSGSGAKGNVKLQLTNQTAAPISGKSTLAVYATASGTIDASAVLLTQASASLTARSGKPINKSLSVKLPPGLPAGSYQLVARVTDPSGTINDSAAGPTLTVAAPFIALSESVAKSTLPKSSVPGGKARGAVLLTIANAGNVATSGSTSVALFATTGSAGSSSSTQVASVSKSLRIQAGKSARLSIPLKSLPALAPGNYSIIALVTDPNGQLSSALVGNMTITAAS
jgi:hypothetical protein